MPYVLRSIRRGRWLNSPDKEWLLEGDLQADALLDLNTSENRLSVWYVEDDRSNFDRIVAALAANRDYVVNFDYVLVRVDSIKEMNIKLVSTKGDTEDDEVNTTWHRDCEELTASKLFALARAIHKNERDRVLQKAVLNMIERSFSSGYLDVKKPGILAKLKRS